MRDESKTKKQLLDELKSLRQQVAGMEKSGKAYRKAGEKRLYSEEYINALVENTYDAIVIVSASGLLQLGGTSHGHVLGYSVEEHEGRSMLDLVHKDDLPKATELFDRLMRNPGKIVHAEVRARHKDGSWRYIEVVGRNLLDNPEVAGIVANYRDVTARKQAEEELHEAHEQLEIRVKQRTAELEKVNRELKGEIAERKRVEERLAQAEAYLRTLMENSQDAIAVLSTDGKVEPKSFNYEHVLGYELSERVGASAFEHVHPDDLRQAVEKFAEVSKKPGSVVHTDIRVRHKDGSWHTLETVARNLVDAPVVGGIVVNFRDITGRRHMEEALKESEENFRALAENSLDCITVIAGEGSHVYVNRRVSELTGYSIDELYNNTFMDLVHPSEVDRLRERYKERLEGKQVPGRYETVLVHKDGHDLLVEVAATRTMWQGKPAAMVMYRDITERRRTEEQLKYSEERFRTLFDNASEGVAVLNGNGGVIHGSPSAERVIGYKQGELVGKSPFDFIHHEDIEKAAKALDTLLKNPGKPVSLEVRFRQKDGSWRYMEGIANNLLEHPRVKGIVVNYRNITERKQAEEALKESEERFRSLVETSSDWVWQVDKNGVYTYASPKVSDLLGYEPEDVVGKTPFDFMPSEEAKSIRMQFEKNIASQKPFDRLENINVRKDGGLVVLETSGAPVFDSDGNFLGYRGIDRDITERKQAEEALRESEAHYAALVDNLSDAVFHVRGGEVVWCNNRVEEIYSFSRGELLGRDVTFFYPRDMTPQEYVRAVSSAMKERGVFHGTDEFQRKDGKVVYLEYSLSQIPGRDPVEIIAVSRDVTERRQMEENLRRSEERFRRLIEHASDVIVIIGGDGTIRYESPSIERVLGYKPEELIGQDGFSFVHSDDTATVSYVYRHLIEHPAEPVTVELPVRHKDGSWRVAEATAQNLLDEPSVGGIVINFRDITERRRAEEERKRLEREAQVASRLATVGQMASGIAHEINNPLASVIGFLQLLLQGDIPGEIRHDLEVIHSGSQRVSSIVRRLLAFAGQQRPERGYVNINDIVETTLALRAYQMELDKIDVATQLAPDLPWTMADSGQLQQVFLNIVINAEMAMRDTHGRGNLSIKTERKDGIIRISFKDNGLGIPEENIEKIFEPFFSTRDTGEGTGLGLSICHGIIAEHNGRIYAESKPGEGATFIVELPIVTESEETEQVEPGDTVGAEVHRARVLVVDDEPAVLQFISKVLSAEGYEVETVDNAGDALERIEGNESYRLVLLDIKMPGMSGIELFNRVQKTDKALAKKIVFMTGDVMGSDTMRFLSKTRVHYIRKPFDIDKLKDDIKEMLA